MNLEKTKKQIIKFIKKNAPNKPAVIGLSGGLDSSVVAYLAVEAMGNEKTHAIISPSDTNTEEDLEYAKTVCKNLGLSPISYLLSPIINSYQQTTNNLFSTRHSLGNLKARIRMSLLYGKANEIGGIVLGTGNKTELMTGYFTKYGDGGVDLLPIGDLYKTEVRELAKYIGIPQGIIDRAPTAGLWEGQTDEDEMEITYETLDKILMAIFAQGKSASDGKHNESLDEFNKNDVEKVRQMMNKAKHKLDIPKICKI